MGDFMKNIIKHNKYLLLFILSIIVVGLITGFVYFYFLKDNTRLDIINTIKNTNNYSYNFILKDLFIMSLILVMSFFLIGAFLNIFNIFYDSFSIGFLINIYFTTFNINGLIYILIYIFVTKLIVILFKIIFLKKTINISRFVIGKIIYKKDNYLKDKIMINFKNALYIIIIVIICNIIILFISPIIMNNMSFLLK